MITSELQGGNVSVADLLEDRHYPAQANAATKTIAAVADRRHILHKIIWSYSDAPTGGRLTITDGSTTLFDVDITNSGPGALTLMKPMAVNTAMVVTLASGAGSVVGKLQFYYSTRRVG